MSGSAETSFRPARPLDASLEPPLEAFGPMQRLAAEALGTALLLAVVVGSGIMGERLAAGNAAVALLGNTLATGAALVVLISIFGPISGAHFNPVVTAMFAAKRELSWRLALAYMAVQVVAAIVGVWAAHLMFAEPILQVSTKARDGLSQGFAEAVATLAWWRRSSARCASSRTRRRRWWASTSPRPTGSPPRPRSPTPR